jgi:hypothetical protein
MTRDKLPPVPSDPIEDWAALEALIESRRITPVRPEEMAGDRLVGQWVLNLDHGWGRVLARIVHSPVYRVRFECGFEVLCYLPGDE